MSQSPVLLFFSRKFVLRAFQNTIFQSQCARWRCIVTDVEGAHPSVTALGSPCLWGLARLLDELQIPGSLFFKTKIHIVTALAVPELSL